MHGSDEQVRAKHLEHVVVSKKGYETAMWGDNQTTESCDCGEHSSENDEAVEAELHFLSC